MAALIICALACHNPMDHPWCRFPCIDRHQYAAKTFAFVGQKNTAWSLCCR
jgi:hypothetical protein